MLQAGAGSRQAEAGEQSEGEEKLRDAAMLAAEAISAPESALMTGAAMGFQSHHR